MEEGRVYIRQGNIEDGRKYEGVCYRRHHGPCRVCMWGSKLYFISSSCVDPADPQDDELRRKKDDFVDGKRHVCTVCLKRKERVVKFRKVATLSRRPLIRFGNVFSCFGPSLDRLWKTSSELH